MLHICERRLRVLVHPQTTAVNGDIVVALLGEEATVKRFYRTEKGVALKAENPRCGPIEVEGNALGFLPPDWPGCGRAARDEQMTTLLAESAGKTDYCGQGSPARRNRGQVRGRKIADGGETLIVVDASGCFDPARMTYSARIGRSFDPAGLMKHSPHIFSSQIRRRTRKHYPAPARTGPFERFGTRHVLIPNLLGSSTTTTIRN